MVELPEDDPVGWVPLSGILVPVDDAEESNEEETVELRESAVSVPDTEFVGPVPLIEEDHVAKDRLLVPAVKDVVSVSMDDE
jgi:hypothetical protein